MPPRSFLHEDTEHMNQCQLHGERLTRIETKLEAIHEQVTKTNHRTTANESALSSITAQMASQQTMWVQSMQYRAAQEKRIEELEGSMGKMKDWKAELRGGSTRAMAIAQQMMTIIALAVAAWAAYSGHVQALAAAGVAAR
jgi:septal ring factor EnvC (AmiA/AmiB activator)